MLRNSMVVNLTGHRPFQFNKRTNKWESKLEYVDDSGVLVKGNSRELYTRLVDLFTAYFKKYPEIETVVTGMAMGVDLAGAEAALSLGRIVHAYVPFQGHGDSWKTFYKEVHAHILSLSAKVFIPEEDVSDIRTMLLQRNIDMVEASDRTLALWDGSPGGTSHCVSYALGKSKDVTNLWPAWEKHRGRL